MTAYQYTSDILADALFRSGEPASGSDFATQALNYVNMAYYQLCRGGAELDPTINEDWVWLRKNTPGLILLQPPITTLTATATLGSTSVTLSAAPTNYAGSNLDLDNWCIRFGTHPDTFRVASHTAGATAVTLDGVYTGTTQTLGACTLFLTDYNLASDVLRVVAPMRTYRNASSGRQDYKVYTCDLDTLEESYPLSLIESGVPDLFAPIGETTAGTKRVRFNRCGGPQVTDVYRLEYEYLYVPAALTSPGTSEEPALPRQYRHLLADFTTAYILGAKNDERAAAIAATARAGLVGMAKENRYQTTTATRNAFRLKPRSTGRRSLFTASGIRIL